MKKYLRIILSVLLLFIVGVKSCFADEVEDAEKLYVEIKKFLEINKDVLPEKFNDVCIKYILKNNSSTTLDNTNGNQSDDSIILYRGFRNKKYVEEFNQGKYFLFLWNTRGSGIYTTTNIDCAKFYSNEEGPETLIKMTINKNEVKILENDYLEKLKELIIENHGEEFGEFNSNVEQYYVFDNLQPYINCAFKETREKLEELSNLHLSKEDYLNQEKKIINEGCKPIKENPVYQQLRPKWKRYYTTNKSHVWFNSGLLTKLMGYDALHSIDYLRKFATSKEEEYLIVNTSVLNILK